MTSYRQDHSITPILEVHKRKIYSISKRNEQSPAVFLIDDSDTGGILVNTPPISDPLQKLLSNFQINYIFYPSHLGAKDVHLWKDILNAETIAHENECDNIDGEIDIPVNHKSKLTRTIDFIPIPGRSRGSCALYCKNLPGILFFGPILQRTEDGWPSVIYTEDDFDFETRLFSALAIQDLKFQYAFLDDYDPDCSKFGPDADKQIQLHIEKLFDE